MHSRLVSALLPAAILVACSSVPDITFGDPGDGGTDGRVIDPNCKPSGAEICDDGIDNDCNGLTDCQDDRCTSGFSCQEAPEGWTAVAFAATAAPPCPTGETTTALKVSAGDGMTASCTCTCGPVGPACTTGSFTLTMSNDVACAVTPTTASIPTSSGCAPLLTPFSFNATNAKIAPQAPTSCAPKLSLNGALTDGRLCEAAKLGRGCGTNQVCAPKPTAGLTSCITKAGKSACPAGFTKRSTAGTDAVDQRMCTGCTCNAPAPCVGGSVSVYDNSMCATNGAVKNGAKGITQTCAATTPDPSFSATHFEATPPTGGCATAPATPAGATGGVTFTAERTVCCK